MVEVGQPVVEEEMRSHGFMPLKLKVTGLRVPVFGGDGCTWDTEGFVPRGPGLYAFTVDTQESLDQGITMVTYVGMTEELWMVTKGQLPDGGSRPAQRYGRPKYAGETRRRVNLLVAEQLRLERRVRHWVMPLKAIEREELFRREADLIARWNLHQVGWNRG